MKRIKLAILFGGKSAEHEVSIRSAKNIVQAIDKNKYDLTLIGIDKKNRWFLQKDNKISNKISGEQISLIPGGAGEIISLSGKRTKIDIAFPILHGPFGEDGTIQGILRMAGIPFVGAGVLGSAVGMDKDVMKRLLRDSGIPIGDFTSLKKDDEIDFSKLKKSLGLPLFVKPANLGSSVGISKVKNEKEFKAAVLEAFRFDNKIIIEEFIKGREIECSVLGNENLIASVPGEIITKHSFYSYEAKYIDENGAQLEIPARLPKKIQKRIQEIALATFRILECRGLGRVDLFLKDNDEVLVNEINTLPGFTNISMYPKLFEASGIAYPNLIERLIELSIEEFQSLENLETSYK